MTVQGASRDGIPAGISHAEKVDRLVDLCRELVKRGIRVEMSDARPAVSARSSPTTPRTAVEVVNGAFVWRRDGYDRHTAEDVAGAADQIADYLRTRDGGGST
ncbi:hypothetical protein [Actinoallomurus rhizosphaericola]|uniref:hypothetical protein n=1 Tax=Actinoallomurus rhizosphaericola TaxID=2952536 RepID=UPI0020934F73|nr:hypothetical protein [Actinoallomurus rhizosphaericola]MCO5996040.1 hypothetical protein [Actinoallomurus rhizosphaericola]